MNRMRNSEMWKRKMAYELFIVFDSLILFSIDLKNAKKEILTLKLPVFSQAIHISLFIRYKDMNSEVTLDRLESRSFSNKQ